ncbi:uncharacterized protein LOC112555596 [Pomacea canaliculata]|uniref:uncharacterized protein LOC112555596 n=1 Tax=Pomacea canaliculata TaxID=400727 RepID=UPI000D734689|nr:uncharacterized protein LOC112555596 [Pomacea canaliculata]
MKTTLDHMAVSSDLQGSYTTRIDLWSSLAVLLGCALADSSTDRLYVKAGGNQTVCLDKEQFSSAWLFLDTDSDGSVSKQEFDTSWGRLNLPERDQAPGDFVEIDTNKDLVITTSDLEYLFRVFDENADGKCVLLSGGRTSEDCLTWADHVTARSVVLE